MKIFQFDSEKINIAISVLTLLVSAFAFWTSYKSYELANLKPKFELGVISHDGYQMGEDYTIIRTNDATTIDLYGEKGGGEFSKFNDLKDDFIVDNTRPSSEIHFYIKNIGKVSAENTKIIFEFNGISLGIDYIENNVDKSPSKEYHYRWEYKPYYPITEKSYCEMHWVDEEIMYPGLKKEFGYSFSNSVIDKHNPYIDVNIVSKTSIIQKMRINVRYHDISEYGKEWSNK